MPTTPGNFHAFADRLRELRVKRGLTQQQLADRAGIAYRSIQYFETGKRAPQFATIEQLANALDVPAGELRAAIAGPSGIEAMTDAELDLLAGRLASRLVPLLAPLLAAELETLRRAR